MKTVMCAALGLLFGWLITRSVYEYQFVETSQPVQDRHVEMLKDMNNALQLEGQRLAAQLHEVTTASVQATTKRGAPVLDGCGWIRVFKGQRPFQLQCSSDNKTWRTVATFPEIKQ